MIGGTGIRIAEVIINKIKRIKYSNYLFQNPDN